MTKKLSLCLFILSSIFFNKVSAQNYKTSFDTSNYRKEVLVGGSSFGNYASFEKKWDYLYPWGSDHNGTARMNDSKINHKNLWIDDHSILHIKAEKVERNEGKSKASPYLPIHYHSAAIHLKDTILINNEYPKWVLKGDFQVSSAKGCWPAFWMTGINDWPPESDFMEFKGNNKVWQNTATSSDSEKLHWQNIITSVVNPEQWHNYKVIIDKISNTNVRLSYFIDGRLSGQHLADFVNKPFWVIINLQMEGGSGEPGPNSAFMNIKNIYICRHKRY